MAVEETIRIPIVIEGTPKPTVQFYKNGKEIKSSERVKVVEEGEKHTLVIEKTTLKDSGILLNDFLLLTLLNPTPFRILLCSCNK